MERQEKREEAVWEEIMGEVQQAKIREASTSQGSDSSLDESRVRRVTNVLLSLIAR